MRKGAFVKVLRYWDDMPGNIDWDSRESRGRSLILDVTERPAWGVVKRTDAQEVYDVVFVEWLDDRPERDGWGSTLAHQHDVFIEVPDDQVPGEVFAYLAEKRLTEHDDGE